MRIVMCTQYNIFDLCWIWMGSIYLRNNNSLEIFILASMLIFVPGLLYADSLSFGNLELNSTPGSSVYLDGQYYGSVNPNGNFVATLGEEYADIEFIQIRIENRGFVP